VSESVKLKVRDFWEEASCGEVYAANEAPENYYTKHARERYRLEPYIHAFARFGDGKGKDILEIGVGMGADHLEWARSSPSSLTGIDLTPHAIEHTSRRLQQAGAKSMLKVADAEELPFDDNSFDLVYSWGVIHHTPDTAKVVNEIYRVLRPTGEVRLMIYHKYSIVGYLLWLRYAALAGRPWRSLAEVYASHLESPGTQAFSVEEARAMFRQFKRVDIRVELSFGDLLDGQVGQRHQGKLLELAKQFWPRKLIRRFGRRHGLMLLIVANKGG
jgi:ubiquinone/menaquinone biosynthesis C-methylase UbiE